MYDVSGMLLSSYRTNPELIITSRRLLLVDFVEKNLSCSCTILDTPVLISHMILFNSNAFWLGWHCWERKITSGGRLNSKHSSKTLRSIKKTNSIFPYMLFRSFPANVFKWPKLSLHSKRFCCLIWNSQSIWKALNHSQLQFTYLSERLDLSA